LFAEPGEQPALAPSIVSTDAQGVITTRGAGRVRGRHELEREFSGFLPRYFENRSYQFTVVDTVAAGGGTVTFEYVSAGPSAASPSTNLRVWKVYGAGNVFHENLDMQRVDDRHARFTIRTNARERRPMQKGDMLEFEFGIFLDSARVEGRTNYYTDTFRYRVGVGGLTASNSDPAVGELGPAAAGLSGGDTTIPYVVAEPELSLSQMALNIQGSTVDGFLSGRRLFHTSFATGAHSEPDNPVLATQAAKVGPLFNQESCTSCHARNGRGSPPEAGSPMRSMVLKVFGAPGPGGEPGPHPQLGHQVQNRAVEGTAAEGNPSIVYQNITRQLADGTAVELQRPTLVWGPDGAAPERYSMRVARPLVGMGLLEAVPEATVLAQADPKDCNGDGISGRPNLVRDPESGQLRLGRLGWKASKVSVRHQVAEALLLDIGVTTSVFPRGECGAASCAQDAPELADPDLVHLVTYMRALGVPPRRKLEEPAVERGAALFAAMGCSSCHRPSLTTDDSHPLVELRGQTFFPYTDLLLHDMGPELADHSERDQQASPSEWRTPPLWGIGLTQTISGHSRYLHDGRARSFLEAILWHGGEALSARQMVIALSAADREALLAFLGSL